MKTETHKLFESMQSNLNEKINHANDEVNRVLANPNAGRNKEKIKDMGYETEETSDGKVFGIRNPKTNKWLDPSRYSREEKKKVDFKGKLDSERKNNQGNFYPEYVPKSLKTGKGRGYSQADRDDMEAQNGISKNVKDYKKAVKDRDENRKWAEERRKSDIPYYEKKVKDAQKDLEFHKNYTDKLEKNADNMENKRKEILDKARAKRKTESEEPLKESYDLWNVAEDAINSINNLKAKIEANEVKDLTEAARLLGMIAEEIENNMNEAN